MNSETFRDISSAKLNSSSAKLSTEAEVNKETCEAFGCLANATIEIEVPVGQEGKISLHLCQDCVAKF